MTARTIEGPEQVHLSLSQVAAYLGLSESGVKRLIAAGEFPQPLQGAGRRARWHWEDCYYYQLRERLMPRFLRAPDGDSPALGK